MAKHENPGSAGARVEVPSADRSVRPGRGRSWVDWEEARVYHASLAPGERTYAAVAAKYDVSPRTVETHARTERWQEQLREVQQEAATRNQEVLVEGRVEEMRRLRRLIDAGFDEWERKLREGMRFVPGDLERLYRLSRAVDELTEPGQASEPLITAPERTPEHRDAVLDALIETGALEQLGLARIVPPDQEPTEEGSP